MAGLNWKLLETSEFSSSLSLFPSSSSLSESWSSVEIDFGRRSEADVLVAVPFCSGSAVGFPFKDCGLFKVCCCDGETG